MTKYTFDFLTSQPLTAQQLNYVKTLLETQFQIIIDDLPYNDKEDLSDLPDHITSLNFAG